MIFVLVKLILWLQITSPSDNQKVNTFTFFSLEENTVIEKINVIEFVMTYFFLRTHLYNSEEYVNYNIINFFYQRFYQLICFTSLMHGRLSGSVLTHWYAVHITLNISCMSKSSKSSSFLPSKMWNALSRNNGRAYHVAN